MRKVIMTLVMVAGLSLASVTVANAAVYTVSSGTIGTGATATTIGPSVELYTPNGAAGSAYIRLTIPGGIPLNTITSLSYTAQVTAVDAGGFAPEVVLNIDANGNSTLDGTGIDWMQSGHNPTALNGDNFLSGDNNPVTASVIDGSFVNRNALGSYSYWDANIAGDNFGNLPYSSFGNAILALPSDNIDATDKVYSIDFVVGTSGSFDGLKVLFQSVELNGVTYPLTGSIVITKYACPDGTTVTRAANGVGLAVPAECVPDSGKTFGYVHGTQTDANAPYPELSTSLTAGGVTDGSGILTINPLPADGRYLVVETDGSNVQLPASAILGLYCQGDGDTSGTNDNQELTFVPVGGTVNCIAYDKAPPPLKGHIIVDKVTDPAADPQSFDFTTTGTGYNVFSLTDTATPNDQALDAGTYTVAETSVSGWSLTNVSCVYDDQAIGTPVQNGEQITIAAGQTATCTFTNTKNPPTQPQVHIFKYVDGVQATALNTNSAVFPMETTFNSPNLGSVTNVPFTLSPTPWGPGIPYEASFVGSDAGANYEADEVLDSPVVGATCDGTHTFKLGGYSTGDTLDAAFTSASSTDPLPSFTNLQSDKYVIVWNETCPTTGTLVVNKYTIGGDGTFSLTGTGSLGTFSIVTANASGAKEFDNLAPGNYTVTEPTVPSGWQQTDSDCTNVAVTAGGVASCSVTNTKIGSPKLGEIRGIKFEDWDADGSPFEKKWEEKLSGWTIYLDTNNNGVLDSGEPSTVTDKNGAYRFKNLPAGTYHVREVGKTGWVQITPISGVIDVTVAGKIVKNINFGNFKLGTISGMKFNDINGNGHKNNGEPGLSGWTINLMKVGSPTIIASAVTDVNGKYSFTNLSAGKYQVREVGQAGWVQTTKNPADVKINSGTNIKNEDFGNHLGPVIKDKGHDHDND